MESTIPIGEFKTHCYQILDQAQKQGQSVIVTRKGKPIAKILPLDSQIEEDDCFFDSLKDSVSINGDIISSVDVKWKACDE
jgi:prevent-host-death family protein